MKYTYKYILLTVLAVSVISCSKNEFGGELVNDISFVVYNEDQIRSDVTTKGQRYNKESEFATETFGLYAWKSTSSSAVSVYKNESVSKKDGRWLPENGKKWADIDSYVFEAIYPQPAATLGSVGLTSLTTDPNPANLAFSYKVPTTTMDAADKDFMLAYYSGTSKDGKAPLTFTHPLTCVNFTAGSLESVASINSITIAGVYESGSCTVRTATYGTDKRQCYSYENDDTENTSTWKPDGSISVKGTLAIDAWTLSTDMEEYNFLLIPQDTKVQNATIIVNITDQAGNTFDISTKITTGYWRAGYTNTYTVSFDVDLNLILEITDTLEDNVKKNVEIMNTGGTTAYVRAVIVGNWTDAEGNILLPWTTSQGTFTDLPGGNWITKAENGATFYYYKNPVRPGTTIPDDLFTSYEAPASTISEGHLEMEIIVQGVKYDKSKSNVEEAWGSEIASQLTILE